MKKCFKYLTLLLVIILVLSGCGKEKPNDNSEDASKTDTSDHKGGTLKVGMPAAPSGVYSSILSSDHSDATVEGYFNEGLIKVDKKLNLNHLLHLGRTLIQERKLSSKLKRY